MKTQIFKSLFFKSNEITAKSNLRFGWTTRKVGDDERVTLYHGELTLPETGKEFEEVPILQLTDLDSKTVIAEMHDPEDIRITLIALKDMLNPNRYCEVYGSFLAANDVAMHWKYGQILANHWWAALSTAFLAEGLPYRVYQGNLKYREDFKDISPEEILSRYCYIEDNSSMIEYYYQRLIEIRSKYSLRDGRKRYMLESMYEWTLLHSYLREVIQGYYRRGHFGIGFILIPDPIYLSDIFTSNGGFKGVKIQMAHQDDEIRVDFNSLRSLSYYKKVNVGEYEFYKNQILNQFSGLEITGFKIGNNWKDMEKGLLDRFDEVENPSFYKAGKTDGVYTFHCGDTKFTLTRGGCFKRGTFYGALRRVENSMFFQMTDLTWDLNGAYLDADDLLWIVGGSNKDVLSEIENHVFTKDDFNGEESGSKVVRYYGDYTDNEYYTWLDEKPCLWFDNGKASTSRTDEWPEVESFLGKPTKEFNIAIIYAEWKIQDMLYQKFPELMEDRYPKKDGFYLRTKALIGRNTEEAITYVENQVRHYLLRRNVFEKVEDIYDSHWCKFLWNRYQAWPNKFESLTRLDTLLDKKEKARRSAKEEQEYKVPSGLPKYIGVLWDDVFKGSRDDDYISGFGGDVTPIKALVRTLTTKFYYRHLKDIAIVGQNGTSYPYVRFEVSPYRMYMFLGTYNFLKNKGRNWNVKRGTNIDNDVRLQWVRDRYLGLSTDDGKRIRIYSYEIKSVKVVGDTVIVR